MLSKLICLLWGHKTVVKAYTGETFQTYSYGGNPLSVALYEWKRYPYCLRCGIDHSSTKR